MRRSLIIDDSSVIRKVARRILEDLDFEVIEAENGQEGLDICRRDMPELVLVDWQMPVVAGVEFLSALRGEPGGRNPKVVFCTSENDVSQIARAMRAGADDYILKPFNREIVEQKLQEVGLL